MAKVEIRPPDRWPPQLPPEFRLSRTFGAAHARAIRARRSGTSPFSMSCAAPTANRQQVTSQPKTPFLLNGIAALALLRLHQKCGRARKRPPPGTDAFGGRWSPPAARPARDRLIQPSTSLRPAATGRRSAGRSRGRARRAGIGTRPRGSLKAVMRITVVLLARRTRSLLGQIRPCSSGEQWRWSVWRPVFWPWRRWRGSRPRCSPWLCGDRAGRPCGPRA
jgi:hypothetical protein